MDIKAGRQESEAAMTDEAHEACSPCPVSPRLSISQLAAKRAIDLAVSMVLLPLAAALGLISAILIKLDSPGPVFFKQTRIGRGGRPFVLYKFRSMYKNADAIVEKLDHLNEAEGPIFKIRKDPRITRVGAILRKTSMDEMPQIINVIRGEMSLVGPRPPLPREVDKYNDYQRGRLAVKPGLTCLW